jgi:translation initiation factor IF-3
MRSMRDSRNQNRPPDRAIKARAVLLIDASGMNLGVVDTRDAYRMAETAGLDLVQVGDGKNGVPVCKIMDHGKWKYEQAKKHKAAKAAQQTIKELKIRPNTSDHDMEYRAEQAAEFLDDGDKVKVLVRFKGRERNHMTETGRASLEKFLSLIDPSKYKLEKAADVGEREISIMLLPAK